MKPEVKKRADHYLADLQPKLDLAKSLTPATVTLGSVSLLMGMLGTVDGAVILGSDVGFTPVTVDAPGDVLLTVNNAAAGKFHVANGGVPVLRMTDGGGGFIYKLANAANPMKLLSDGAGTQNYGRLIRFAYGEIVSPAEQAGVGYFNYMGVAGNHPVDGPRGVFAPTGSSPEIGFIGFIFSATNQAGWLKLQVDPTGGTPASGPSTYKYTILDWAYETVAGQSITIPDSTAAPEPSSLASLAAGAAGLLGLRRRRQQRLEAHAAEVG